MLSDTKVLIIEDDKNQAVSIQDGLVKLKNENNADQFNKENIRMFIVDKETEDTSSIRAKITRMIDEYNIDVLFIDLHLINNSKDGISIIRGLMEDENIIYRNIPKYIITDEEAAKTNDAYKDSLQYAYFMYKGEANPAAYKDKFERERLIYSIPILVKSFREIKNLTKHEMILHNMQKVLGSIKDDTNDIKLKIDVIDHMNQTMFKLFPLISPDKKNREKMLSTIKEDLSSYLSFDFDDLFQETTKKLAFIESVSKEFNKLLTTDLKKGAWETFKDSVKSIAKSQGIEDDNAALCATKLTYRGYSKISAFITGRVEV